MLVTADDEMPFAHAETIAQLGATIATVDGEWKRLCERREIEMEHEAFKHSQFTVGHT